MYKYICTCTSTNDAKRRYHFKNHRKIYNIVLDDLRVKVRKLFEAAGISFVSVINNTSLNELPL